MKPNLQEADCVAYLQHDLPTHARAVDHTRFLSKQMGLHKLFPKRPAVEKVVTEIAVKSLEAVKDQGKSDGANIVYVSIVAYNKAKFGGIHGNPEVYNLKLAKKFTEEEQRQILEKQAERVRLKLLARQKVLLEEPIGKRSVVSKLIQEGVPVLEIEIVNHLLNLRKENFDRVIARARGHSEVYLIDNIEESAGYKECLDSVRAKGVNRVHFIITSTNEVCENCVEDCEQLASHFKASLGEAHSKFKQSHPKEECGDLKTKVLFFSSKEFKDPRVGKVVDKDRWDEKGFSDDNTVLCLSDSKHSDVFCFDPAISYPKKIGKSPTSTEATPVLSSNLRTTSSSSSSSSSSKPAPSKGRYP